MYHRVEIELVTFDPWSSTFKKIKGQIPPNFLISLIIEIMKFIVGKLLQT